MTIEEAIEHCKEVAKESREAALSYARANAYETAISCKACGQEHEQLAEWLTELKHRRDREQHEGRMSEPARWLQRKRNGYTVLMCSACEKQKEGNARTEYCPNCGARMDLRTPTEAQLDMADSVMMGGAENGN